MLYFGSIQVKFCSLDITSNLSIMFSGRKAIYKHIVTYCITRFLIDEPKQSPVYRYGCG